MLTEEALNTLKKEYFTEDQTQKQIAQRRNIDQQTISKILNGTCQIGNMEVSTFQKMFPYSTINEGGGKFTVGDSSLVIGRNNSGSANYNISGDTQKKDLLLDILEETLNDNSLSEEDKVKYPSPAPLIPLF